MPNPIADLEAYKAGVNNDVTTQSTVDSIPPTAVGAIGTDMADLLLPYLQSINNQGYLQGTAAPSALLGSDLQLYWQQLIAGFSVWRKENGIWVLKITMAFVIILDGILSGLRAFIEDDTVTVSPGTWAIDQVRYSEASQTQFTVPAADANWLRYDLIYADDNGDIGYTNGTASSSPAMPTPATGQIAVDYVVVPSVASGSSPYLLSGGSSLELQVKAQFVETSDANGAVDLGAETIPPFPTYSFYPTAGGPATPGRYDPDTQIVDGLDPSTEYRLVFIG